MSQRIHCIRAAINKGYGRIHPELSFSPPYAFKPTHKYKQRGVMRISEHMLKGRGRGCSASRCWRGRGRGRGRARAS